MQKCIYIQVVKAEEVAEIDDYSIYIQRLKRLRKQTIIIETKEVAEMHIQVVKAEEVAEIYETS